MSDKVETTPTAAPEATSASPSKEKAKKEKKGKKPKEDKAKKPAATPAHPPVAEMVMAAVKALDEKGGSSSVNIKKYLKTEFKVDTEKLSTYIRKALRNAVTSGKLLQTKGKNGSFKLPYQVKNKAEKKATTTATKKLAIKSERGRPKKDAEPKVNNEKKVKARKKVEKKTQKVEKPKSSEGGRGRPKKEAEPKYKTKVKPKAAVAGKGRGRPKKTE